MARLARTTSDLALAAHLLCAFNEEFDDPHPDERWLASRLHRLVVGGDTFVAFAEFHGQRVGVAVVRIRPSLWEEANECYLAELYVAPAYRGRGLGSGLLEFVMEEARRRGATYMDLTTTDHDEVALALYERMGFDRHEGRGPGGPTSFYLERDL